MRYSWFVFTAVLIANACGCSGGGRSAKKVEGEDPAEYARATKQQVLRFVQVANENLRSAGGEAEALLERLQVYTSRPVGENKSIYEQLTQTCKELVDAAKRSPGSADVKKKVDELTALANKLPG
jgi:hypothetical protein